MLSSPARPSDTIVRLTAFFAVAILVIYLATRATFAANSEVRALSGEILLGAVSLEAAVLLTLAARAAARTASRAGLAWGLLAAAQVCRLIGDVGAFWTGAAAGSVLPNLVALAYAAYYPLFIAGLLLLP